MHACILVKFSITISTCLSKDIFSEWTSNTFAKVYYIWSATSLNIPAISAFYLGSVLNPVLLVSCEIISLKSMEGLHLGEINGVWREMRVANVVFNIIKETVFPKIWTTKHKVDI